MKRKKNKKEVSIIEHSLEVGMSFGLTSAVITTLGLMIGLNAGTHSRLAVIGGILTIAIADAFSDSLGVHISEESEGIHTKKQVWVSTISTFISKFFLAMTFLVPILFFDLTTAIIVNIAWGLVVITAISYYIIKKEKSNNYWPIAEHLFIAVLVIVIAQLVGMWISRTFG